MGPVYTVVPLGTFIAYTVSTIDTPVNSPVALSIHCGFTAVSILTFATDSGASVVNHCPNGLPACPAR